MSIGTLPDVNFIKIYVDVKRVTSASSRTLRLKNNQIKSRERAFKTEKTTTKVAVADCGKLHHNWVASRKTQSHQDFRKA